MWAPHGLALLPDCGEPQAAHPRQRRDVGERSLVSTLPAPSLPLASLHPDPFELLTLLSNCLLVPESVQGMDRGLALTDPGSFLVLLQSVARKPCPDTTRVWPSCCSKPLVGSPQPSLGLSGD